MALKTANTLIQSNYKVGLFVSPHISSFRERIQINGVPISELQVEQYLQEIFDICEEENIPATFFEITTALAFHIFAAENCDVVVLERGLGGRLDATNVINKPALSIITTAKSADFNQKTRLIKTNWRVGTKLCLAKAYSAPAKLLHREKKTLCKTILTFVIIKSPPFPMTTTLLKLKSTASDLKAALKRFTSRA